MFLKCSLPGMVSGLVWAFCSIVDGIFVGNYLGSDSLAAVNLAWPILSVFMAVSDMLAVGSSVRISMHLGAGDVESARRVFSESVRLIVAVSCVLAVIGVLLGGPMVRAMGAEGFVADTAAQYIAVFSVFAPMGLLFFATDNYLRISGTVSLSMHINVGVSVVNILLLALLVGFLGMEAWASAFSTGLSISLGTVASLVPFIRHRLVLEFVRGKMSLHTVGRTMYNGMPSFFNTLSGSLFGIVANTVLLAIAGNYGVSAYGIVMYVNSIMFSLFVGMNSAMQPAISYNHGAGDGRRVLSVFRVMCVASLVMGIALAAACILFNQQLSSAFLGDDDADVAAMGAHGLGIFALTYLFTWVAVDVSQTLTATDLPAHGLAIGVMSQLFIPVAALLPMSSMGLDGVWWSMVVASVGSAAFAGAILLMGTGKGIFRMHGAAE